MGVDQLHHLQILLEAGAGHEVGAIVGHGAGVGAVASNGQESVKAVFTGYQPGADMIASEMVGLQNFGPARALGLACAAFGLAACATTPAAMLSGGRDGNVAQSAPFNPDAPPRVLDYSARLQCVPFARQASGIQIYGDANTWWRQAAGRYPRSSSPAPGSVLVMRGYRDPGRGHVAVVTEIVSERIIRVDQANWLNGGEISVGVPVLDVSPDNDWSEVRVWYIPGSQWGARIYEAEGFIHAFALSAALS
jgi:hypothetical protein